MRPSSNRALHAALSGWLVGLLAVGPAAAQSSMPLRLAPRALPAATGPAVTVVGVAVDGADRAETARLAYEAEGAVARSGRLTLVRLADALEGGERPAREAEAAMQEGQRAYDDLDTQKALQQFDKAVRAYEASDLSRRFGELIRARVMKAASQVANGENTAAQLEIRAVLAVEPRAQFSPNFFPPDQMAFIEKERKAVLAAPRASLRVSTEPVPAQVYVNGQFRGVSPVELTDVPVADHYVTVVAPGYAVAQRRAREGAVALTLTPVAAQKSLQLLTERVARDPDGKERDAALRELGTLAGVSQVLAVLVRGGTGSAPLDVTALRLDVSDGHNLAYALGSVPRGGGMAAGAPALLEPLVATDAPRQDGKPVSHFAGGGARRTVGYVLMATGVALLAGGVYFGLEASAKQDEFKRTPQTSPRATDLRDTGKTYALVADAGILAGLVSAGLGTYFAFSGGGGSAPAPTRRAEPAPAPKPQEPAPEPRRDALPMPPPPKGTKPAGESLPMPPPPSRTAPSSQPASPPPSRTAPSPQPAQPPPAEQPPAKPADSRRARAEEERKRREAEEQRKQEEAEAKRREEEAAKRRAEAEEKRKREEAEAKRKREEEERRRREEEEKKKRPALDEDDLRNY